MDEIDDMNELTDTEKIMVQINNDIYSDKLKTVIEVYDSEFEALLTRNLPLSNKNIIKISIDNSKDIKMIQDDIVYIKDTYSSACVFNRVDPKSYQRKTATILQHMEDLIEDLEKSFEDDELKTICVIRLGNYKNTIEVIVDSSKDIELIKADEAYIKEYSTENYKWKPIQIKIIKFCDVETNPYQEKYNELKQKIRQEFDAIFKYMGNHITSKIDQLNFYTSLDHLIINDDSSLIQSQLNFTFGEKVFDSSKNTVYAHKVNILLCALVKSINKIILIKLYQFIKEDKIIVIQRVVNPLDDLMRF